MRNVERCVCASLIVYVCVCVRRPSLRDQAQDGRSAVVQAVQEEEEGERVCASSVCLASATVSEDETVASARVPVCKYVSLYPRVSSVYPCVCVCECVSV